MIKTDTAVAISTPRGEGGIGVVRLSGPEAVSIGRQLFRSRHPLGKRIRRVEYGRVLDMGEPVDTGVAWVFAAPHSYTGEDTVEICCHGSMVVLESLVEDALRLGAVSAGPGEFTRRAFVNGRIDLLQAEAVIDLIQARSRGSLENAYGLAGGRLSELVRVLKARLVKGLALIEVGLDFSEDDIDEISRQRIREELGKMVAGALSLADTFEGAKRRQDGYLVALIGRPNVGKSTLFNALLSEDRAIVTPIPGTTRDSIEGLTTWSGEAIRLVDTAGIRQTDDPIEIAGIERTTRAVSEADVVLAIFDCSAAWCDDDRAAIDLLSGENALVVFNKVDLPRRLDRSKLQSGGASVEVSALTGTGVDEVKSAAAELLPVRRDVEGVGITRERHYDCLSCAIRSGQNAVGLIDAGEPDECVAVELQAGLRALGEMLGDDIEEDVLDSIFSEFCIGK